MKLNDGEQLVELDLGQGIFGGEKQLLFLKDFVVAGFAGNVAIESDFDSGGIGLDGASLREALFFVFLAGHQGVGDFLESIEHDGW